MTLPAFPFTTAWLTNGPAAGYPTRGAQRRVEPIAIAAIHVTANPANPPASARQERDYANRASSGGPSAHLYIDPKGGGIWAIDPQRYAAWSNGDIRSPRTAVPGVNDVLAFRPTYNVNEAYDVEIEQVGRFPDYPITPEQTQTTALVIAQRSLARGIPIERRTVHLHSDLNTETRANCPVPSGQREAYVADVIRLANEYRLELENRQLRDEVTQGQAWLLEWQAKYAAQAEELKDAKADLVAAITEADERTTQRDEALEWGKRLQAHGGAILATDPPEWME